VAARGRGRPVEPPWKKIERQDAKARPVVQFVNQHMAADPKQHGARARAIRAALKKFPHITDERTIARMLEQRPWMDEHIRTMTVVSGRLQQETKDWASQTAGAGEEARRQFALVDHYLSPDELTELDDCSFSLVLRIARDREALERRCVRCKRAEY
jgi:hypothetical protein